MVVMSVQVFWISHFNDLTDSTRDSSGIDKVSI